jgi:hypothetical protein
MFRPERSRGVTSLLLFIAMALPVVILTGCESGPTQEQKDQLAQAQAQRRAADDARRAKEAKEQREREAAQQILSAQRKELTDNLVGPVGAEPGRNAAAHLETLNALLAKVLQEDRSGLSGMLKKSTVTRNPVPLLTLDERSGKLVVRISETDTRSVLLRHLQRPNVGVETFSVMGPGDAKPIESKIYKVFLKTTPSLILSTEPDYVRTIGNGWTHTVALVAANEADARAMAEALNGLIAIYAAKKDG